MITKVIEGIAVLFYEPPGLVLYLFGYIHNAKRHIKRLVRKSIKLFFKSVIYGHKRIFKADKSQAQGTG